MSYARWRAASGKVEELEEERRRLEEERRRLEERTRAALAERNAELPFLGDDIFVLIAAELDIQALGRLACAAQRFWRKSVADPRHKAGSGGAPELWSVPEEAARRRLYVHEKDVRGWVPWEAGKSWLRLLREAEKLLAPLRFTLAAGHPCVQVVHSAGTALGRDSSTAQDTVTYRAANGSMPSPGSPACFSAACGEAVMTAGVHFAEFS